MEMSLHCPFLKRIWRSSGITAVAAAEAGVAKENEAEIETVTAIVIVTETEIVAVVETETETETENVAETEIETEIEIETRQRGGHHETTREKEAGVENGAETETEIAAIRAKGAAEGRVIRETDSVERRENLRTLRDTKSSSQCSNNYYTFRARRLALPKLAAEGHEACHPK